MNILLKLKLLIIVSYFIFTYTLHVKAQNIANYYDIKFNKLNIDNGLPSNIVTALQQDQQGFIWLGTSNGVVRFDGIKTKIYQNIKTDSNSLPNNNINDFIIDGKGFFWIATANGLAKFSPNEEIFIDLHTKKYPDLKNLRGSFSNLNIDHKERLCVYDDNAQRAMIIDTKTDHVLAVLDETTLGKDNWLQGRHILTLVDNDDFWFLVDNLGFCIVHLQDNKITSRKIIKNLDNSLSLPVFFENLLVDKKGNIYIANIGLYFLSKNKKNTLDFEFIDVFKGKKPLSELDFSITSLVEDKDGNIWINTNNYGIKKYNPATKEITEYVLKPLNYINTAPSVTNIVKDNIDNLWFKHDNGILNLWDYKSKSFKEFKHDPSNPNSISTDINLEIGKDKMFYDKSGNYWLLTGGTGINYFSLAKAKFAIMKNLPDNPNSLSANSAWGIFEDNKKNLWAGISISGLNVINLTNGEVRKYLKDSKPEFSGFSTVTDILQASDNEFWFGSVPPKRFYYDNNKKSLKLINEFRPDYNDTTSLSAWFVYDFLKDSKGNVWIGGTNGLDLYLKPDKMHPNGSFKHYIVKENSPQSIANNQVWHIMEDNKGRLWISTAGGLSCMNAEHTKVINYFNNPNDSNSISSNNVKSVMQDSEGIFWIATEAGGLNKFDEKTNRFIAYNKSNGFPSENIFAIFEDNGHNLWLSSTDGIIKFNQKTNKAITFTKEDGLQSKQFVAGSFFQNRKSGEIYFGGSNGINHFNPDSIKLSNFAPNIIFISFKIFNKEVEVGKKYNGNIYLNQAITNTNELTLSYKENVFSLEFAALDYSAPKNIKYSYIIEGANKSWIETDAENKVLNYTDLAPGEYLLKIKSTNADGIWCNNERSLKIIITPPWWKTTWFKVLLVIFIFGAFIFYYKYKTYEIKKKNQELEHKVAERTNEVMQQKEELQQQAEELEATNEELTAQSDALRMSNDELNQKNDEIEKSFKISQLISEFGQRVTSTFDLESINEIVYGYIYSIMPTDAFGIGLYNDDKNAIEYIGFIESGNKIENFTKSLNTENSLSAWCFNNQKPVFINDLTFEYKNYIHDLPKASTNKQPLSIIHLPLSTNDRKLGIIVVNSFQKNSYTQLDLVHLQSIASYITIALDNADAYKTVNAQKEKLLELDNFKDAMTGMIVHDLKNPLNAIIGLSSLSPEDEMMQMVNSAGNQMLNLVLNILDVQKFENTEVRLNLNDASLYEIANEANRQVSLLIKQKKQNLSLNILPQTIICTDSEITVRVFVNMLTNAIKYTQNGGSISINQENVLLSEDAYNQCELIPDSIKKQSKFKESLCLVSVSDTGQGIPADKLHLVFEKFGQVEAKKSGGVRSTGLGMTFCKMVVEAHNCAIWITSEVGKGTSFYFTLPFSRNDASIHNENFEVIKSNNEEIKKSLYDIHLVNENGSSLVLSESEVNQYNEELKILVADDDKYSIDVIKNCLSSWGKTFLMFEVGNGKDAVDAAKIIRPDIILLDWEMPQLDGLEALKQIKTIPELFKTPVAMVTSRSGNAHIHEAFEYGASDYIKKPIDKTEALFRIQTLANLSKLITRKSDIDRNTNFILNETSTTVMIVDDVFEIRQLVIQFLQGKYLTIEAENGMDGLQKAKELLPDIIISDVNMPEMNGLELCVEIKKDLATCHIPVILLTAQNNMPDNIAGFEAGADVYLTKPVSSDLLNSAIKNQIENREKLRKVFSKVITSEPSEIEFVSSDEKFISRCIKTIENNIENSNFHLDYFVKEMAMSYGQLYGKIKYLTNLSIAELIRSIRLKRAKQILDKEDLSIKELIAKVGFENTRSFQRMFKNEFGITPSEYAKKMHKDINS